MSVVINVICISKPQELIVRQFTVYVHGFMLGMVLYTTSPPYPKNLNVLVQSSLIPARA